MAIFLRLSIWYPTLPVLIDALLQSFKDKQHIVTLPVGAEEGWGRETALAELVDILGNAGIIIVAPAGDEVNIHLPSTTSG